MNNFISKIVNIEQLATSTESLLYTVPAGKSAIVFTGIISSVATALNELGLCKSSVTINDGESSGLIMSNTELEIGAPGMIPKIVLNENDTLNIKIDSEIASIKASVTLSILEIDL